MDQNFKDALITCLEWLGPFIFCLGVLINAIIYLKEITRMKTLVVTSKANDNGIKILSLSAFLFTVCYISIDTIEDPTKLFFTIPFLIFGAILFVIFYKITIARNRAISKMVEKAMKKINQMRE